MHGVVQEGDDRIIIGSAEDVTSRVQVEEEHRQSLELHRKASDHALVPMIIVDHEGTIRWSNEAMRTKVFGEDKGSAPSSAREILANETDHELWSQSLELARRSGSATANVNVVPPSGVATPHELDLVFVGGESDQPGFFVSQWLDNSDRLERESELATKAATLEDEADRDPLTGLRNRRGLERVIARQLALRERGDDQTIVILLDCDHFKKINDGGGHAAGDVTLQEIAKRLERSLRPSDVLARVGGDEFLVVLPGARLAEGIHVGEKLRRAVADEPIRFQGKDILASVSVGVVAAPSSVTSAEEMISVAGSMLSESKSEGRNRVAYLDESVGLE